MGICRRLYRSFNFVNIRIELEVISCTIKFHKKIHFHGKFVAEF